MCVCVCVFSRVYARKYFQLFLTTHPDKKSRSTAAYEKWADDGISSLTQEEKSTYLWFNNAPPVMQNKNDQPHALTPSSSSSSLTPLLQQSTTTIGEQNSATEPGTARMFSCLLAVQWIFVCYITPFHDHPMHCCASLIRYVC